MLYFLHNSVCHCLQHEVKSKNNCFACYSSVYINNNNYQAIVRYIFIMEIFKPQLHSLIASPLHTRLNELLLTQLPCLLYDNVKSDKCCRRRMFMASPSRVLYKCKHRCVFCLHLFLQCLLLYFCLLVYQFFPLVIVGIFLFTCL